MTASEALPRENELVRPTVSVIVPARNEEASLASCLDSLLAQTGIAFEVIVVDDHSTDRTREIADQFAKARPDKAHPQKVRVIEAGPLPTGWTGKNNALINGVRGARGEWLLFTDADTIHLPGSLARALAEAQEHYADMLSYSPEQIAVTFWEMAVLPVVFAELAREYPPAKVRDPGSQIAAANGQYILVRRDAYDEVGGHAAIAGEILEDVALARAVKTSGRKIRFRYADDAVRTRMYRNFRQLCDGWTKNLVLLFPNPGWLATKAVLRWGMLWAILLWPLTKQPGLLPWGFSAAIGVTFIAMRRLHVANFDLRMEFLGAVFGMPMFAYLLLRSKRAYAKGNVFWKDRTYSGKGHLLATGH
jgi:glycosyltransferase involved in cell wall biosynthesis